MGGPVNMKTKPKPYPQGNENYQPIIKGKHQYGKSRKTTRTTNTK